MGISVERINAGGEPRFAHIDPVTVQGPYDLTSPRDPLPDPRSTTEQPGTMTERLGFDDNDPTLLENPNSVTARIGRAPGELEDAPSGEPAEASAAPDAVDVVEDCGDLDTLIHEKPLEREES